MAYSLIISSTMIPCSVNSARLPEYLTISSHVFSSELYPTFRDSDFSRSSVVALRERFKRFSSF